MFRKYHSVNAISGGLSVFVSFDLYSQTDALAFAMDSESFLAYTARQGCTEVSTKHLNSEELSANSSTRKLLVIQRVVNTVEVPQVQHAYRIVDVARQVPFIATAQKRFKLTDSVS